MRFLDKILGSKPAYPPLPADNEAMVQLDEVKAPLEEFAAVMPQPIRPRSMR